MSLGRDLRLFFSISRYEFLKNENLTALQYWAHVNVDAAVGVWVETRVLNVDQRASWDLVASADSSTRDNRLSGVGRVMSAMWDYVCPLSDSITVDVSMLHSWQNNYRRWSTANTLYRSFVECGMASDDRCVAVHLCDIWQSQIKHLLLTNNFFFKRIVTETKGYCNSSVKENIKCIFSVAQSDLL